MTRHAIILSVGDELLLGQSLDTNGAWLADQLVQMGIVPLEHRTVGDDRARHAQAIRDASTADVLIMTGGLGPTQDDLTRYALGDVVAFGRELEIDAEELAALESRFAQRRYPMPESNRVQALMPLGATMLPNPRGTAPGLHVEHNGCQIFALPGPPREMKPMFDAAVRPRIAATGSVNPLVTVLIHAFGQGESRAAEGIADLMERGRDPEVGVTASGGVLTARIRSYDGDRARAVAEEIETRWGDLVYGRADATLPSVILDALRGAGAMLVTAESCTGGGLGRSLVDVAGSSEVYAGGWITYANEAKVRDLGVSDAQLREHGAVSVAVAGAMAQGALRRSGADWALSTTGIAGPGGGTPSKPVGTVYIGLARRSDSGEAADTTVHGFHLPGDRELIRSLTVLAAYQLLRWSLKGLGPAPVELDWRIDAPHVWREGGP